MSGLEALFGETGHVSGAQECARVVLIFAYGLLIVRLIGRRLFGKWAALDIIVSVIIGSNLSRALTGGAPLFGTLAATTVLLGLHWILAQGAARFRIVSRVVEGAPLRLAAAGESDRRVQRRWAISEADIHEALRNAGLEQISAAREVILEPSGKISVLK
jgi:uncharacterized membrane protein YcaP (DUF421 family)